MRSAHDARGHDADPHADSRYESPWNRHPLAALLICVVVFAALVVLYVLTI